MNQLRALPLYIITCVLNDKTQNWMSGLGIIQHISRITILFGGKCVDS